LYISFLLLGIFCFLLPNPPAGHRIFVEEWQRLLEDAAKSRALFAGLRRERRNADIFSCGALEGAVACSGGDGEAEE
jgi:hypothetical protein